MLKKRLICFITVCAVLFMAIGINGVNAGPTDSLTANAILGKKLKTSNFSTVKYGNDASFSNIKLKDQKYGWQLEANSSGKAIYLNFDLDKDFADSVSDGSEFKITVSYFDEGKGYFRLIYDALDKVDYSGDVVYLNNEKIWKTAEFNIKNAYFGNRLDGKYDFRLAVTSPTYDKSINYSTSSVVISEVNVKKYEAKNKIYVKAGTDEPGNSFKWFSESKIIHNELKNLTDNQIEASLTYTAMNENSDVLFSKSETMVFAPNEIKTTDVDFGDKVQCDIYKYHVYVLSENNNINSDFQLFDFAVLKTDPDGIKNERVYYANHIDNCDKDILEDGVKVLGMSNSQGFKMSMNWNVLEKEKENMVWDDTSFKIITDKLRENNMKSFTSLQYNNNIYGASRTEFPTAESNLNGWRNYINFLVSKIGDITDLYKVWNEPNHPAFNKNSSVEGNPASYVNLFNVSYDEVKKSDPDAKVGGPEVTGIQVDTTIKYFNEAVEAGLCNKADAITVHPYIQSTMENSSTLEYLEQYKKKALSESGRDDIEFWHTEVGYTSADNVVGGSSKMQGALNVRQYVESLSDKMLDATVLYNFEHKGIIKTDREHMFGNVSSGIDGMNQNGKYFVPEKSYAIITAMNYILAGAEPKGSYDNNNIKIKKFKSDKFGNDILVMWSTTAKTVTLNLGTDKIKYFDELGNEEEIYGNNGVFTFLLNEYPVYISGSIQETEILPENSFIEYDSTEFELSKDDITAVSVKKYSGDNYTLDVALPQNIELVENRGFTNENGILILRNMLPNGKEGYVKVKVMDGNRTVQTSKIKIVSAVSVATKLSVSLPNIKNINRWIAHVDIKNNSMSKTINGYLRFTAPESFKSLGNIDIGNIPRGLTGNVSFYLPELVEKGQYMLEYDIVMQNEILSFSDMIEFTIATYAKSKPTIDGVINNNEWNFNSFMYADDESQLIRMYDWSGKNDLSGKSAVMWDEKNFYMAAVVTDNIFYQKDTAGQTWNGDSIQFGIVYGDEGYLALGQGGTTFNQVTLALTPDGPQAYRHLSQDNIYKEGFYENYKLEVVRKGNQTIYEFEIPWENLLRPGDKPTAGQKLGYSFLINDNDGAGRRGWIEYASGIGQTKDTSLFTYMTLLK